MYSGVLGLGVCLPCIQQCLDRFAAIYENTVDNNTFYLHLSCCNQPCAAKPRHSTFMTIIRVSQPRQNISRHGKCNNLTVIIAVIIFRLYRHRDRYTGFMGITAILWIYKINWLMFTFWYSWVCQFTVDYYIQLAQRAHRESSSYFIH